MDQGDIQFELRDISELRPDANNMRVHSPHNLGVIQDSIQQDGFGRSILLSEGEILAGNGTVEAAMQAGINKVLVVKSRGNLVIAHERLDMSDDQKLRMRFRDNYASDTSVFDDARVGLAIFEHPDLFTFLHDSERDAFLLAAGSEAGRQQLNEDQGGKLDQAAPLAAKWGIAPGQTWIIPSLTVPGGEHRLILGDARDNIIIQTLFAGARAELLVWDPPYGVSYSEKMEGLNKMTAKGKDYQSRTRLETPISNDSLTPEQTEQLVRDILINLDNYTRPGCPLYLMGPSGNLMLTFLLAWEGSPFEMHQGLIWAKNNHVLGRGDYHYRHEMIYYGWKQDAAHPWYGDRSQESILNVDMPRSNDLHPTMKPVALYERLIINSSPPGGVICDPTAGSGTALIAAEQQARLAFLCELASPDDLGYGGVILERAFDLGLTPRLDGGFHEE